MKKQINNINQILLKENSIIDESDGSIIVKNVIFQEFDKINGNNRIYPLTVQNVILEQQQDLMSKNMLFGELEHPFSEEEDRNSTTDLHNVSHIITEMHLDGKNIVGTLKILPTPSGIIQKNLLKSGCTLGISLRQFQGQELNEQQGVYEISPDDFLFITYDIVSLPSNSNQLFDSSMIQESQARLHKQRTLSNKNSFEQYVYQKSFELIKKNKIL